MSFETAKTKLIIFLKAPRVGQVKTRLAASIGEDGARLAYKTMVEHLLRNLRGLERVQIRYSPKEAEDELREWLGGEFEFVWQGNGSLGERLHRAFDDSFREENERVAIIGSDCPYVTVEDIRSAFEALKVNDAVLGPANDGGYWLVGLRQVQACLFDDIPWSTEAVLETTLRRVREQNLSVNILRTLDDIDQIDEWQKFSHAP